MLQKLRMLLLTASSLFIFSAPLALAGVASAQPVTGSGTGTDNNISNGACSGALSAGSDAPLDDTGSCSDTAGASTDVNNIIKKVINILSVVVGVVAVIMIVIGGFRYITSGGSTEKVQGAKNTILYAIIGLIIVALAQIIVKFILNKATGQAT